MGKETLPQGEVDALMKEFELKLNRLRNIYEQYFMGMERIPPNTQRKEVVRLSRRLDNLYIRQTASKFRIRALIQRFNTYKVYWNRVSKQIEEGTYVRDIQRARRNQKNKRPAENAPEQGQAIGQSSDGAFDLDFDLDLNSIDLNAFSEHRSPPTKATPSPQETAPSQPVAQVVSSASEERAAKLAKLKRNLGPRQGADLDRASIRGASVVSGEARAEQIRSTREKLRSLKEKRKSATSSQDDQDARRVYNALLAAKRKCNESTANLNYESLKASLHKQKAHLKETRGAKSVDFDVVIKDGKAFLKPQLKK